MGSEVLGWWRERRQRVTRRRPSAACEGAKRQAAEERGWAAEARAWAGTLGAGDGEWLFDSTIASLAPWTQVPAQRGRRGCNSRAVAPTVHGRCNSSTVAPAVHNRYSVLYSLNADSGGRCNSSAEAPAVRNRCNSSAEAPAVHSRYSAVQSRRSSSAVAPAVCTEYWDFNSLVDDSTLLGAVAGETRGGRVVEAVIDSGAVHCVTPPGLFPGKVSSSPWSRAGRGYRAANGTGIKNLGQVDVPFATAEGHRCKIPFQVAEVEQPLLSVAHLTSAGNLVQLGDTDGTVVNLHTGRTIALERRGNIYYMKMFIADAAAPLPFHRQGA